MDGQWRDKRRSRTDTVVGFGNEDLNSSVRLTFVVPPRLCGVLDWLCAQETVASFTVREMKKAAGSGVPPSELEGLVQILVYEGFLCID